MIDPDEILRRIDALSKNDEYERRYLGASEIGEECSRKLWLQFHGYIEPEKFEPRMLRLFFRGNREELIFETHLYDLGYEVINRCTEQAGFYDGFFGGHGDGVWLIEGDRVATEYKTHSVKSFAKLKRGQLKKEFPKHYAQCIIYAGKFDCKYAIYMAVCKDTDALFIDVIEFNEVEYREYLNKAEFITMSDKPPDRIANVPTAWACKWCNAKDVCFGLSLPRIHCKNCTSSFKSQANGKFGCEKNADKQLDSRYFCEDHSLNPYAMQDLKGWAPIEFFPEYRAVKYQKRDGSEFINGKAPFGIESKELTND